MVTPSVSAPGDTDPSDVTVGTVTGVLNELGWLSFDVVISLLDVASSRM